MAVEIVMPRLGWTMEEGTLLEWLKRPGEAVEAGEVLFTVETDKALNEVESFDAGRLHIPEGAPAPGDTVPVGTVIGYLLAEGEEPPAPSAPASPAGSEAGAAPATPSSGSAPPGAASPPTSEATAPAPASAASAAPPDSGTPAQPPPGAASPPASEAAPPTRSSSRRTGTTPGGPPVGTAPATLGAPPPAGGTPDHQAPPAPPVSASAPAISPRARRLAQQLGIDWRKVRGTGRTGRITEDDVRAAAADQTAGGGSAE